jgi:ABC-type transport system involved in cytochrome c biogenesis ATPase subunit
MFKLEQNTQHAQLNQRIAAAVLADAEAERLAAGERRKVAEAQLMASTLGVAGVGIMGNV